MASIAEVGICVKLVELAKRCGLKASDVDGEIGYIDEQKDPDGAGYYAVHFCTPPADVWNDSDRFFQLLGMKDTFNLNAKTLGELEDTVDRALSKAPRGRTL